MCGKLETIWIAYLDGKVSEQERALVEGHLHGCEECARRWQEFLTVARVLGEWQAPEPSPWFDARLRRRIAEDARQGSWLPRLSELFPPIPVGIGVLVLLACLLISGGNPRALQPQAQTVAGDPRMAEVLHAADEIEMLSDFELLSELKKPEIVKQGERH